MGNDSSLHLAGRTVPFNPPLFIDSGVLVAWLWGPDAFHREAALALGQLIALAWQRGAACVTSTLAISEVWDVLVRRQYADEYGPGTWRALGAPGQGAAFAAYADPVGGAVRDILVAPWLNVVPLGVEDLMQALVVAREERLRTNDACHVAVARRRGCGVIVTTDAHLQSVRDPQVITLLPVPSAEGATPSR